MKNIKADKRTFIRWKVYIDRARMYIGYVQFFMIGLVFFEAYRDTYIGELIFSNMYVSLPVLFILFIGLSLFVGRLDTIFGLREEELRNSASSNPMIREIHSSLEELKKDVAEIKEKSKP